jgi:hypothetical protein
MAGLEKPEVEELLHILIAWQVLGAASAKHISLCSTCITAELLGGKGYCTVNDDLWSRMMHTEIEVRKMVPKLLELGIDVEGYFREMNFRFHEDSNAA